jgi:S-ribosylhomocysteine lyase
VVRDDLAAARLESFELDHDRVRAPYVRLAAKHTGEKGDVVTKFDLRLVQPNEAEIPTAALHTIEHLIAGYLRAALPEVEIVDASPMGCRTGFYLTVLGEPAEERVLEGFAAAMRAVAAHEGPVPGCSRKTCGNWRDHNLEGARAWAASVLEHEIIVQPTVTIGA